MSGSFGNFESILEKHRPERAEFCWLLTEELKVCVQIYSFLDLGQEAEPKSTCGGKRDPRGFPFVIAVLFVLTWNVHWAWDKELGKKDSCYGKALLAETQHASAFELFMQNRMPSA